MRTTVKLLQTTSLPYLLDLINGRPLTRWCTNRQTPANMWKTPENRKIHKHAQIHKKTDSKHLRPPVFPNSQSIKIHIGLVLAPLQDLYSEALPTQAKRKRTVLRTW